MLARHIPKVLAPQRCLSLGVRRMVEGGISESSNEHFHASGQGMDANIAGSTMEDFLAARNETDRVAKIKGKYFKNHIYSQIKSALSGADFFDDIILKQKIRFCQLV